MSNNITLNNLLKSKGLLFPTNSEEVIEFEKLNDINDITPKDWDNPVNIIKRGEIKIENVKLSLKSISDSSNENLAMAAREGNGKISEDVRKKMLEDRKNAKK